MPLTPGIRPLGKTQHEATRRSNQRLLLQGIFDEGPISRADLARSTGLGRATVSDITANLIVEGLVVESGLGASTGGKPPTLVELDPDGRFTVAVDMSRRPIEAALLNLRGRIVARSVGKTVLPKGRDALDELHRVLAELVGTTTAPALGIGIGVPGTVDRDGHVVGCEQLGWESLALRDDIEDVYGIPTYVYGDAEVAAVAEFSRTATDIYGRMLYVKVDDRIAVGMITNDRLNRTPIHGGDLSHVQIAGWDEVCACGRRGCLGTRVSMTRILGPDHVAVSSEARRRLAVETSPQIELAAETLGRVLAPIVASIDADLVVMGGELGGWGAVPKHVAAGIELIAGWAPEVVATRLAESGVLLGAAAIVLSGELGVVWG
jgi:predicted NBD/HSP70 family sugar kinase